MSTPIRIIAALNGELAHVVTGTTTATLNEKNADIRKLLMALEDHQASDRKIMADLSLSSQGQRESIKRLAINKTIPALKWIHQEVSRLEEKKQKYEQQFFTIDSGLKELAERLPIFIYLWNKFDVLDVNARRKRFFLAAEANEVTVMSAMLEHPEGPMVEEEMKQRALTERAKTLFPQDYENYQQTEILLEFLTMIRDWIARWLYNEVGVEIPVIRNNFGDDIADALTAVPELASASK